MLHTQSDCLVFVSVLEGVVRGRLMKLSARVTVGVFHIIEQNEQNESVVSVREKMLCCLGEIDDA